MPKKNYHVVEEKFLTVDSNVIFHQLPTFLLKTLILKTNYTKKNPNFIIS